MTQLVTARPSAVETRMDTVMAFQSRSMASSWVTMPTPAGTADDQDAEQDHQPDHRARQGYAQPAGDHLASKLAEHQDRECA
jgi:hypothetical protein